MPLIYNDEKINIYSKWDDAHDSLLMYWYDVAYKEKGIVEVIDIRNLPFFEEYFKGMDENKKTFALIKNDVKVISAIILNYVNSKVEYSSETKSLALEYACDFIENILFDCPACFFDIDWTSCEHDTKNV